jgi:hypothetical protein
MRKTQLIASNNFKMKKILFSSGATLGLMSPLIAFAQYGYSQCGTTNLTLCTLINRVIGYLNQILFLLIALSVVVFVYYVFKYFIQPNEDRKEARTYVMYSVIGFFVILSMWGLVNILQNTFGLGNSGYAPNSWNDISNIFPR